MPVVVCIAGEDCSKINVASGGIRPVPKIRSWMYSQNEIVFLRQVFLRLAKVSRHRRPSSLRVEIDLVGLEQRLGYTGVVILIQDERTNSRTEVHAAHACSAASSSLCSPAGMV